MQQELESRVLTIVKKKSELMEEETGIEPSMTENEIKDHIEWLRMKYTSLESNNDLNLIYMNEILYVIIRNDE
jgi:hypothetical protein